MSENEIILMILVIFEFILLVWELAYFTNRKSQKDDLLSEYNKLFDKMEDTNLKLAKINNRLIFERDYDSWEDFYEIKKNIINHSERKLLYNVIKLYKEKVKSIRKRPYINAFSCGEPFKCITIEIEQGLLINLPTTAEYAFLGLELGKEYTLEELGLDL